MKSFLILFLILSINCFAQKNNKKGTIKIKKSVANEIVTTAEKMPEYVGNMNAFISLNLRYPQSAKERGAYGTSYITFVVNTDSTISNVMISKKSGCPECDIEALRAVSLMTNWKPASNKGVLVRYQYYLPIKFTLK